MNWTDKGWKDAARDYHAQRGESRTVIEVEPERPVLMPLPEPIDLWAQFDPPELPHCILPPIVEKFARERAEIMGADPAGLALAGLTVCAAAIPDRIMLQVKKLDQAWREAARLWVALIGMPSTKKSP